ncbi:DUF4350 domain-containing protein [Urbifossiella limnaea]|uniref:DUF4350 domain-containing protein n=1 Tax=Urbifossiella limnaea TaxID=2528023 RepID=A0A517XZI0_9BACT|nr:DUF4350 domain-containing protein [Urbifossiella limnaea]QDU22868.1 hypothetical protein ETAA1_48570 [Urbifossiella limnaea]
MAPAPDAVPGDLPADPASRLWWAVPAVGFLALLVVALLFGGGPQKVDFGTSYDASPAGFRAAYLLLERLGYPVDRSRRPPAGDAVRWVFYPDHLTGKEATALDDWVRRGGVVLLADDETEVAEKLGLPVVVSGGRAKVPEQFKGLPFAPEFHKGDAFTARAPDVSHVLAGGTEVDGPPGADAWGTVGGRPLVTIHPRGRGEVWLLRRPDVFANDHLRGEDNAVLLCRLADAMLAAHPDRRIAFDEFCHGLRDRPDVAELLFRPPVLWITLQALLLTALVLWHAGVRFGPVRPDPPPPRRSKAEFLDALAGLLERTGDRGDAFRAVRDDLLRRLEAEYGLPAGTPPEQVAREAARRRGVNPDPLVRLLTAEAPPGGRGAVPFLDALKALETAARESLRPRPRDR